MRRLGIGYRTPLAKWIHSMPEEINCLELTAEHFFDHNRILPDLGDHYPIMLHGLGLSLGTPGPLDQDYLQRFAEVCDKTDPLWISEHIAFTRSEDIDLGHLNPIPFNKNTLAYFSDHVIEVSEFCKKPIVLENITSHMAITSDLAETDFMNRLCEKANCGLLLDVTNLYVNSQNHTYNPLDWLHELQPDFIRQLHIVGFQYRDGAYHDSHSENIQPEIYNLLQEVLDYAQPEAVIIERDQNFPAIDILKHELNQLGGYLGLH